MGIGDNLMASGFAKGASARGKRVAFGDGRKVIWDVHSEQVFRHNPNICHPGHQATGDVEWVHFYRGNRLYNRQEGDRWVWNLAFHAAPGELYLSRDERQFGKGFGSGFVLIEPNLPSFKMSSANKRWAPERYEWVASSLRSAGYEVIQLLHDSPVRLSAARKITTPNFRLAAAVMAQAALYIGPEGGMHHTAAAFGVPAVVLFGGWIPPAVTGYDFHANLSAGGEACGMLTPCDHCRAAMDQITVDDVLDHAEALLNGRR